ncbi:MAG: hypothetical protein V1862_03615 [Methanobacteriota archaeon]
MLSIHVTAVPPLPAEFYGTLSVDGKPAPIGTVITAQINGVEKGSIVSIVDGFYGGPGLFDIRLKVNVSEEEYRPGELKVVFMINGQQATQNVDFEPGSSKQLDLSTGSATVTGQPTGIITPSATIAMVPGNTLVPTGSSEVPSTGTSTITYGLEQPKTFKADDGLAELFFTKDTMLFSPDGQFLNVVGLRPRIINDLPPFPSNQSLIFTGYAYEIIPEGTYFNPKGVLTLKLPPDRAYEIINASPVIYEYLPQTAAWEPVNTASNIFTNLITADIYEAAIYGLFIPLKNAEKVNTIIPQSAVIEGSILSGQASDLIQSNQTNIAPIITPQSIITPQDIITPLPSPEVTTPQEPDTQVFTPEPTKSPNIEEPDVQPVQPFHIPGMNLISILVSAIKSRLSGPILTVLGFIGIIAVINVLVYAVYRYWWQQRARNG